LPIALYLAFLKRNRGAGLLVIFLYCVLSLLTEFIFYKVQNLIVFSCFTILEFTLLTVFFFSSLVDRKLRYVPLGGAVVFYIIAISSFNTKRFDSLSTSVEAILAIMYSILLLYEQIRDPKVVFVYNTKKFWVCIAFFIYFSATLFLFVYTGSLSEEQRESFWPINNFFEMLKNILFCVSFIMKKHYNNPYAVDSLEP